MQRAAAIASLSRKASHRQGRPPSTSKKSNHNLRVTTIAVMDILAIKRNKFRIKEADAEKRKRDLIYIVTSITRNPREKCKSEDSTFILEKIKRKSVHQVYKTDEITENEL